MVTAAQPPQLSVPHMAMVHGAVYDAVNAIDGGHERLPAVVAAGAAADSKDAAAATAAYRVLADLVPAQQPTLHAQYAASLAAIADGPAKRRGIAVGEAAAAAMIAARTDDGRFGPFRFTAGSGPGVVEAGAAGVRQRSQRVAEGRHAVHDRARRSFAPKGRSRSRATGTPTSSPR